MSEWNLLTELPVTVTTSDRAFHAGCYAPDATNRVAINRPTNEDAAGVLNEEMLDELFAGLEYQQISDSAGEDSPLTNEIWRVFLAIMALALVVEAALCLG